MPPRPLELATDLRLAWRSLKRHVGFTSLVVITLAFGNGTTTTLFAVVKGVLLTPLPYTKSDEVAVLWSAWKDFDRTWLSFDEYGAWRAEIPAFANVALYSDGSASLTDGDQPERVRSATVDREILAVLGISPVVGRIFTAEEDRPNGFLAVILSHDVWHRRYGGFSKG